MREHKNGIENGIFRDVWAHGALLFQADPHLGIIPHPFPNHSPVSQRCGNPALALSLRSPPNTDLLQVFCILVYWLLARASDLAKLYP